MLKEPGTLRKSVPLPLEGKSVFRSQSVPLRFAHSVLLGSRSINFPLFADRPPDHSAIHLEMGSEKRRIHDLALLSAREAQKSRIVYAAERTEARRFNAREKALKLTVEFGEIFAAYPASPSCIDPLVREPCAQPWCGSSIARVSTVTKSPGKTGGFRVGRANQGTTWLRAHSSLFPPLQVQACTSVPAAVPSPCTSRQSEVLFAG
jgi:hypothetical protein